MKLRIGPHSIWEVHVAFFGEYNRAWAVSPDEGIKLGRNISGYVVFELGQREQLSRINKVDNEECLAELCQVEKKALNEHKNILRKLKDVGGTSRIAESQRQLEVKDMQEKIKRREKEKCPGWYYDLELADDSELLSNWSPAVYEEATGAQTLKCLGPYGLIKCTQCQLAGHKCFLCKRYSLTCGQLVFCVFQRRQLHLL